MAMQNFLNRASRFVSRNLPRRPMKVKGLAVSVIIPVYNTEEYLHELLDSLIAQDLPAENFEVIAVDDGSTDSSGKILDAYAAKHKNIRVVHQENSGWPGKPRNVALDMSSGKFVFFADSDDFLAPNALRELVEFALKYKVDVVLPKVVGSGGRLVFGNEYAQTLPSISPLQAIKTLTPQKLVSRELIVKNKLRFPEEKVRLEDGMFMVSCYLLAKRIGINADDAYYNLRARDNKMNISSQGLVPHEYTASIASISEIIRTNAPSEKLASEMTLALWSRKGLKIYGPARFKRYRDQTKDAWIEAHSKFVSEFIPVELSKNLEDIRHRKTELVRAKDRQGLLELNEVESGFDQPHYLNAAGYRDGTLELRGIAGASNVDSVHIFAVFRGQTATSVAETTLRITDGVFDGIMSGIPAGAKVLDFYIRPSQGAIQGKRYRLPCSGQTTYFTSGSMRPYATQNENFSLMPIHG